MSFIKRLLAWIMAILAIICAIIAIAVSGGMSLTILGFALHSIAWTAWAALGLLFLGIAYILDPEVANQVTESIGDAVASVGEVAGDAIGGVVNGAGTVVSKLLANPLLLVAGGIALWVLWPSGNKNHPDIIVGSTNDRDRELLATGNEIIGGSEHD